MTLYSINRQRNILDYALGSLWRNRFKNSAVFLVFSLVIFFVASFRLVTSSLDNAAEQLLTAVPDITVQKMTAGRQDVLRYEDLAEVEELVGIKEIRPRIWGYYFDELNGANYTVIGDASFADNQQLPGLSIVYGVDDGVKQGVAPVVVGQSVIDSKNLAGRYSFSLFRPDLSLKSFSITGAFAENTSLVTGDLIVMGIEDASDLFGMGNDELTDLVVSVGNPAEIDTIAKKISERLPGSRVVTKNQIKKTYRAAFGWRSGFGLVCLLGSVAAFIIFAWDKASGLSEEQRREVGILKAVGWQTADVMSVRFWESVVISLLAFSIGYTLAWAHVLWFDGLLFRPVLLGWSVLSPPLSLLPVFRPGDLMLIFSISILPYLAATVIPAWRSALVRPDSIV
jgi:ABC-type lipoprotein release transport system permease subunit